jgi:phosphoglycerate dehydrogenase-like enzyme
MTYAGTECRIDSGSMVLNELEQVRIMKKKTGIYFCSETAFDRVWGEKEQAEVAKRFDMAEPLVTRENWKEHLAILQDAEVVVSSWGGPILDDEMLTAMPNLKMYFYGAGTINGLMTDASWERGIRITNAVAANAVPVAEFCLSQILFSLKHGWKYMQLAKENKPQLWQCNKLVPGNYGSRVGLISFGQIARKTCELLKPYDMEVLVSTGHQSPEQAEAYGITYASMEEIFKTCDVVSIHLPSNEKTKDMIGKELLEMMKPDSTLINTARGEVINQSEMIEFLKERTDVYACIDVTEPEPPEPGCPLFTLRNVVLTPHLAGSMGPEARRMGAYIIEEMDRWLSGEPMKYEISREAAIHMA